MSALTRASLIFDAYRKGKRSYASQKIQHGTDAHFQYVSDYRLSLRLSQRISYPPPSTNLTYNILTVKVFWFFGELGVNLFALTTGYFQSKGRFKWGKLILLIAQVFSYSMLTNGFCALTGGLNFSGPASCLSVFFPIIFGNYWFATAYVITYLLSPYLNRLIEALDRTSFRNMLVTLSVLYILIPTCFGIFRNSTESWLYYNRLIWLIIAYFAGAYIRRYPFPSLKSMKCALIPALAAFALMTLSIPVFHALNVIFVAYGQPREIAYFWFPNTALMVLLSVSVFCVFLQLDIPYTPWINRIASTTFGIYLLHTGLWTNWLWETCFAMAQKIDSPTLIPQILALCAGIFLAGMVVDFARQALERVTLKKWLSSERFLRFEKRFDVNITEKQPRLDANITET